MTDVGRRSLALWAGLVSSLLLAECAAAAALDVKGEVRIGLRGGGKSNRRTSAWAPVYVPLQASEAVTAGAFQIVIESTDSDEVPFRIAHPIPALAAGEQRLFLAYVPPGSGNRYTSTLRSADGKVIKTLTSALSSSVIGTQIVEPHDTLYLTLGSSLPELSRALKPPANDNQPDDLEQGVTGFAVIQKAEELPDRWYGYDGVDVILLATSNDTFITALLEGSAAARRDALLEWVRRGGRLIVCAGRDAAHVAGLLEKMNLDCAIQGKSTRQTPLPSLMSYAGREAVGPQLKWKKKPIEIAHLVPGPSTDILVREEAAPADLVARPLIVQTSCGLGRVVVIGFDLDGEAFTTWEGQPAFWKKVQAEFIPRPGNAQRDELSERMQRALETFGEVPVISFGWVALFLLGYIALVGPIDYFILKKGFKRLELTWITFPIVVIAVSVGAYLAAYSSKGNDLWTNKVDLIDIDLHGAPQVQGTAWWSLFNPRSQSFTVGLEPAAPGWFTPAGEPGKASPATVSLLETPSHTVPGSPGLFRKAYDYAGDATGVRDVPVPVWATRTFTASWRLPLAPREPLPIEADVRLSRDGTALNGTIVNGLPVELQGATLIYRGKLYAVGSLMPGQRLEVSSLFEARGVKPPISEWDHNDSLRPQQALAADSHRSLPRAQAALSSYLALKPALFFSLAARNENNSGLRSLDQAWRITSLSTVPTPPQMQYRSEAILVARTPSVADAAEAVTAGPASPSRLWLGALPGREQHRPAIDGYLAQETYVRVYIPVRKDR
jgi:hypothetical protein